MANPGWCLGLVCSGLKLKRLWVAGIDPEPSFACNVLIGRLSAEAVLRPAWQVRPLQAYDRPVADQTFNDLVRLGVKARC